jgi:hypothetical protein
MLKIKNKNRTRAIACAGLISIMMNILQKRDRSVWVKQYRRRYGHFNNNIKINKNSRRVIQI